MFIVNWDIPKLCSQWIRRTGLNCFRGLLCAGCNSREPLFTGGKKFCIPCTVRISTEVNEISALRINTFDQRKWFSAKQAHYWSARWLCSSIFCHLDLKNYRVIVVSFGCCVHLLMVTLQWLHCLSYAEAKRRSRRSYLTGLSDKSWLIQKTLSCAHFLSCCFLLRTRSIMCLQIYLCQGSKFLNSVDFGEFFPFEHPSQT